LPDGARFFCRHPIVRAIRRQAQARARLRQGSLGLLHSQLVILLFELRDNLSLAYHAAEIDVDCLQPARNLHPNGRLIVSRQVPVHGNGFADRNLSDLDGPDLTRLRFAVRSLTGGGVVALATRRGDEQDGGRTQPDQPPVFRGME
jgi:hypothetical protein